MGIEYAVKGDLVIETQTAVYPRGVAWKEIVGSLKAEPDDYQEPLWKWCDGFEHTLREAHEDNPECDMFRRGDRFVIVPAAGRGRADGMRPARRPRDNRQGLPRPALGRV